MEKENNDVCDLTHSQKGTYDNITGQGTLHINIIPTQDLQKRFITMGFAHQERRYKVNEEHITFCSTS
jgi:hypothetical protein